MRDANLTPTGRELKAPADTLVECTDPAGLKHTVITFQDTWVGHPALTTGVDLIMSFMAYPMVTGLVECNAADTKRGRYAYPTGAIWTVKELMRSFELLGQKIGTRAALEMCYLAGMVLHEAGETGPLQGCFSHGNLNPWRIGLKADGQLQVFGYGLAQVEVDTFLGGSTSHLDLDSIRYAPPERLERQPEQPSSDTYALTLIAYEMITGKPLYDEADAESMLESVKLAKGVPRIASSKLPEKLRDVFGSALVYDPDRRLQGMEYVEAIGTLLDDPSTTGRTLSELMERMTNKEDGQGKRKLVKASETTSFTPEQLAALTGGEEQGDEDQEEKRWSSLATRPTGRRRTPSVATPPRDARRRTRAESSPEPSPPREDLAGPPRRRRRRKSEEDEPEAAVETTPEESPAEPESTEEPRRRRRRRAPAEDTTSETEEPSEDSPKDDDPAASEEAPPRRRRRRAPPAEQPSTDDTEEPPRRRRRRRRPEEDGSDEHEEASEGPDPQEDDVEPESEGPQGEASAAEPAPPRRRRRRRPPSGD